MRGVQLRVRSRAPGRIRWDVSELLGADDIAAATARYLQVIPEFTFVRVNAGTGRILVCHLPELSEVEVAEHVRRALEQGHEATEQDAERLEALRRERVRRAASRVASATLVGVGVLLGAPAAVPVIGASVFLTFATAASVSLATHSVLKVLDQRSTPAHSAAEEQAQRTQTLRRLLGELRPHRRTVGLVVVCGGLAAVARLLQFAVVGLTVDMVTGRRRVPILGLRASPMRVLVVMGSATLAVSAVQAASEYIGQVLWRNLSQSLQHGFRSRAHGHVLTLSVDEIEARRRGNMIALLTEDIHQLDIFFAAAWDLVRMTSAVALIGTTFLALAPHVAWLAVLTIPAGLRLSSLLQAQTRPLQQHAIEQSGLLTSELAASLEGMATVKMFAAEENEGLRIRAASQNYRAANTSTIGAVAAFAPTLEFMGGVAVQGLRGGLLAAWSQMTAGAYTSLAMLTGQLFGPLTELGRVLETAQRALASCERIYALLDVPAEPPRGQTPLPRNTVRGRIEFDRVYFGYDADSPLLRDLSFSAEPGQITALVGTTGSGKSTLIKLLLCLHSAQSGRILLDGKDVSSLRVHDLRRVMGVVSQDVFLFHGSLRDNIALGMPSASHDAIERVAQLAGVHDFIASLPHGYGTMVGDRGYRLSGGQRQRVALARALLHEPPILILDEATSQVDNRTEADIYAALGRLASKRTVLMVAHRLSAVRRADSICVLERGRIGEKGRHEELVRHNGLYAALWRLQAGECNLEAGAPSGEG